MAKKEFPLSIVIRAIDRATAPMRAIQSVVGRFGAKFRQLSDTSGLTAAFSATKRLGGALGDLGTRLGQIGAGFAAMAGISAASAWRIISSFAETGGTLYDMSRALGVTAETLQELRYAAKQNGIENEVLDNSLGILNRNLGKAFRGKGPIDLLNAMKIPLRGLNGQFRTTDEMLPDIAEGLSKIRNPALRSAAAAEFLGKGATKMLPMLLDGKKGLSEYAAAARRLGIVISNDAVKQADEFGDKMDDLKLSFTGVRNIIGMALLPTLTRLAEKMTAFVIEKGPAIKAWFDNFAENLPDHLERLRAGFDDVWDAIKPVVDVVEILVNTFGGSNVTIAAIVGVMTALLLPALVSVTTAMWALNVALWANPIGIVLAVIVAIVAALAYFALKVEDGKIKLTAFGEMLVWLQSTPLRMVSWYLGRVAEGIENWKRLIDWVKGAWDGLWSGLDAGFQRALGWVSSFANKLGSMIPDWARNMFGGGTINIPTPGAGAPKTVGMAGASAVGTAPRGQDSHSRVTVDLNGLPPGSRVQTQQTGKAQFELNQGYAPGGAL